MPGTTQHTVSQLERLGEDAGAWFWLADPRPAAAPLIAMRLIEDDPDGVAFSRLVAALRMAHPGAGELIGVAWNRGGLVLTSPAPTEEWEEALLMAWDRDMAEMEMLRDAALVTLPGRSGGSA